MRRGVGVRDLRIAVYCDNLVYMNSEPRPQGPCSTLQGFLAHKKTPIFLETP